MKKTITLLSIAAVILLGACKKEKTPELEPEVVVPTVVPLSGTLAIIAVKDLTSPYPDHISAFASFYARINPAFYIKVDSVIANNVGLMWLPQDSSFHSPDNTTIDATKVNWEVKGNNGIPSFTYLNQTGLPIYTGYNSIPDSIIASKGYTLTLTGLSNTDTVIVMMYDGFGGTLMKSHVDIKNNPSITFTAAELQTLNAKARIQVALANHHYETFGGKQFLMGNEWIYYKNITIKP